MLEKLKKFKKLGSEELKSIKGGNRGKVCYIMCPVDYSCIGYECIAPDTPR